MSTAVSEIPLAVLLVAWSATNPAIVVLLVITLGETNDCILMMLLNNW